MSDNPSYQYLPAEGWYFTHPNSEGASFPRTFYRVALWRVETDGSILGLISVRLGSEHAADPVRLISPPRGKGAQYVHMDDLTDEDRAEITKRRFS
ncbi:hypothetical protein [Stenotrophomonas sp. HMWF003]|uniref:hypothetical protein n=1 Tax=Stenotrophomonas sp. HMWF003 TaxID=2056840 RepID=UPI000D461C01|nr:hypothetical protein [Stenotrophomonas sp. HMWF003]PTT65185.1 hypothetical protein DBR34_02975 [Stenotrophomonas sp. HMWF003]